MVHRLRRDMSGGCPERSSAKKHIPRKQSEQRKKSWRNLQVWGINDPCDGTKAHGSQSVVSPQRHRLRLLFPQTVSPSSVSAFCFPGFCFPRFCFPLSVFRFLLSVFLRTSPLNVYGFFSSGFSSFFFKRSPRPSPIFFPASLTPSPRSPAPEPSFLSVSALSSPSFLT